MQNKLRRTLLTRATATDGAAAGAAEADQACPYSDITLLAAASLSLRFLQRRSAVRFLGSMQKSPPLVTVAPAARVPCGTPLLGDRCPAHRPTEISSFGQGCRTLHWILYGFLLFWWQLPRSLLWPYGNLFVCYSCPSTLPSFPGELYLSCAQHGPQPVPRTR